MESFYTGSKTNTSISASKTQKILINNAYFTSKVECNTKQYTLHVPQKKLERALTIKARAVLRHGHRSRPRKIAQKLH
jgi:hypothetical protein